MLVDPSGLDGDEPNQECGSFLSLGCMKSWFIEEEIGWKGECLRSTACLLSVEFNVLSTFTRGGRALKGADEFINLASRARTKHILDGDATGGGHLWPGLAGKTPFPKRWSGDRIMHELSDIATDPASRVVAQQGKRTVLEGTRGGNIIRVVTDGRDIITGFPVR